MPANRRSSRRGCAPTAPRDAPTARKVARHNETRRGGAQGVDERCRRRHLRMGAPVDLLSDHHRLEILLSLHRVPGIYADDLAAALGRSENAVSQALRDLRGQGRWPDDERAIGQLPARRRHRARPAALDRCGPQLIREVRTLRARFGSAWMMNATETELADADRALKARRPPCGPPATTSRWPPNRSSRTRLRTGQGLPGRRR